MSYIYKGGELPPETILAHSILKDTAFILNKRYDMHSLGSSERGEKGKYHKLGLSFEISRKLSKSEARKILVDCVKELLNMINGKVEFHKYMTKQPFTDENVELSIFSITESKPGDENPVQVISLENGKVYFRYANENDSFSYMSVESETFSQASIEALK